MNGNTLDTWRVWAGAVYAAGTVRMTDVAARSLLELAGATVESATVDHCDAWWSLLRRAPQTRASYLDGLRRFYSWRQARRPELGDPTRYLRRPGVPRGVPRPVDGATVELAVSLAGQPERAWVALGAWAGLRRSEIAALRPADVWRDHAGGVELRVTGKGGRTRVVPAPARLSDVLAGYGWPAVSGETVYRGVRAALAAAGDPAGAPHRLRHAYATTAYQSTGDVLAVARLLGHASVATTQVYAGVPDERLRQVVAVAFAVA